MKDKFYIEPASSERDHRKLEALGKKLGIPVPVSFLEMEVTMPNGEVVHHHKQRAHSWTRNMYNHLFSQIGAVDVNDASPNWGGGFLNFKALDGAIRNGAQCLGLVTGNSNLAAGSGYICAAGAVTSGILVGSGVNAESFEDYACQTLITNGVGGGQLAYSLSNAYVLSYVAGTKTETTTIVRYMNNNSPGDVLVNEVVLSVAGIQQNTGNRSWAVSRDHLAATITIPATGQLKVTYTISLVYPA